MFVSVRFYRIFNKMKVIVKEILGKISVQRTITKFDKFSSIDAIPGGSIVFKGAFKPPELDFDIKYDEYGCYTTRHISFSLSKLALNIINKNSSIIKEYIGPSARLDDIYIGCINPSLAKKKGISEGWHHDHCGHRIKLWMCLKGDGSSPTLYIPNTHKRSYMMSLNQLKRIFGRADYSKKPESIALRLSSGDIGIFDTNGLHRGGFDEKSQERVCLVIEFISRGKSNLICDRAPCGPGGSLKGLLHFSSQVKETLNKTNFLDEDLLKSHKNGYSYSVSNLKKN
tara:strand:+ start:832 stop:1683 length:852 start_codon:yes stop_codon:yes gene_type:complete